MAKTEIIQKSLGHLKQTYELISVLVACEGDFLNELVNVFSSHGRALSDNLDVVLPREPLTVRHLHLFVIGIQLVARHGHDALLGCRLFQLLNPRIRLLHTLSASGVIDDEGGVGVAEVHAVEHHVALLARQVVQLERDVRAERLDSDWQVLLGHRHGWLLVRVDLLAEHAVD